MSKHTSFAVMEPKERALPLSWAQLVTLMKLVRKKAVKSEASVAPGSADRKKTAWQSIAMALNTCNPNKIPRTGHHLKRNSDV